MRALLLVSSLFIGSLAMAQEKTTTGYPARNSFFAEVGGPGILFSANLDRRFKKSNLGFGGRIGIGFVTGDTYDYNTGNYNYQRRSVVTIPVQLNYLFGKPNSVHIFEVGAGASFAGKKIDILNYYETERSSFFGTASFMYRRQPKDGGFTWRIGFTPLIARGFIQPSAAAGVGYNF
jgi:hypothetical protein